MYANLSVLIIKVNKFLEKEFLEEEQNNATSEDAAYISEEIDTINKKLIEKYNKKRKHKLFIRLRDDIDKFYIDKRAGPIYLHKKADADFRQLVSIYGNLINSNLLTDSTEGTAEGEAKKESLQNKDKTPHETNKEISRIN